jgi:hypothetical protein
MSSTVKKAKETPKLAREGKQAIAGYFDPAVSVQLKQLGLEHGQKSIQDLLAEAINLLFVKYKKSPIA